MGTDRVHLLYADALGTKMLHQHRVQPRRHPLADSYDYEIWTDARNKDTTPEKKNTKRSARNAIAFRVVGAEAVGWRGVKRG